MMDLRYQNLLGLIGVCSAVFLMMRESLLASVFGGLFLAVLVIWICQTGEQAKIERERERAEIHLMESRAHRVLNLDQPALIVHPDGRFTTVYNGQPFAAPGMTPEPIEQPAESDGRLCPLQVGKDLHRMFVNGGSRSGKSFYCKALSRIRIEQGDMVFAIDPEFQDAVNGWPRGVQVVGAGDDFDGIERLFTWIDEEKNRRMETPNQLQTLPQIIIFFDEINAVLSERPELAERYITVLRRYAKYKIGIVCIGQSNTVDSIGLKGLNQLKYSFECMMTFRKNALTGERGGEIDFHNGEKFPMKPVRINQIDYKPTNDGNRGVYMPVMPSFTGAAVHGRNETQQNNQIKSGQLDRIMQLYNEGKSFSQICREIYGFSNGRVVKAVKDQMESTVGLS